MLIKKPFKKGFGFNAAPYYKAAGGGGGGATTFNPSDKSANLTLDATNLIATATGNNVGVRSIASVVTNQKVYMEYVPTVNANDQQYGFALATHNLSNIVGSDESGAKFFGVTFGGTYGDFGSADHGAAMPSYATGNRVGIAYDDSAKRFWSRVNGGAWSNSGDPAAGTGGRVVSVTGTLFACIYIGFNTEITTANFSSATWVDTPPSGFTQLA